MDLDLASRTSALGVFLGLNLAVTLFLVYAAATELSPASLRELAAAVAFAFPVYAVFSRRKPVDAATEFVDQNTGTYLLSVAAAYLVFRPGLLPEPVSSWSQLIAVGTSKFFIAPAEQVSSLAGSTFSEALFGYAEMFVASFIFFALFNRLPGVSKWIRD